MTRLLEFPVWSQHNYVPPTRIEIMHHPDGSYCWRPIRDRLPLFPSYVNRNTSA